MEINETCQVALDLFRRGFCPIPILPSTKHPACKWDPWKQDLDEAKIRHHFERNPEHWLGVLTEGGLFVVDADTQEGVAALHLLNDSLDIRPSIIVQTRRGEHHYYRLAEGVFAKSATPDTRQFPSRCDIKTGRALVLVPPSPGKSIEIDEIDHFNELQALTQDQVDAIFRHNGQEPPREHMAFKPVSDHDLPAFGEPSAEFLHEIPRVKALLSAIDADCGYQDWFRVCAALYSESNGSEEAFVLFDEWSSRGSKYPGRAETMRQWEHCRRYVGGRVSLATVAHIARNHGADLSVIQSSTTTALLADMPLHSTEQLDEIVDKPISSSPAPAEAGISEPPRPGAELLPYSLKGKSDLLEIDDLLSTPVLDGIAMHGQMTLIFAPPNMGKTLLTLKLLIDSIEAGAVNPECIFYINADDNAAGLLAKLRIAEDAGFHMLAPGMAGFDIDMVNGLLAQMAKSGTAAGATIIIDTLKKIVDPMDKSACRRFTNGARPFVTSGGSLICLGHVNKNRDGGGSVVYGGTSDLRDDADCAFTLDQLSDDDETRVVQFSNIKQRGGVEQKRFFRYSTTIQDYRELLDSVELVKDAQIVSPHKTRIESLTTAISSAIEDGITKKGSITDRVRDGTDFTRGEVERALDAGTGDDPLKHCWNRVKGENNAWVYSLLQQEDP